MKTSLARMLQRGIGVHSWGVMGLLLGCSDPSNPGPIVDCMESSCSGPGGNGAGGQGVGGSQPGSGGTAMGGAGLGGSNASGGVAGNGVGGGAGSSATGGAGLGGSGGSSGGNLGVGGSGATGGADAIGGAGGSAGTAANPDRIHEALGGCRFHFGAIDRFVRNSPELAQQVDFFTPGWMGQSDTFNMEHVCDETAPGEPLEGLTPVIVAYVAAFYAKRHAGLNDCNVAQPDLCGTGSEYIKQNLSQIVAVYASYAQGFANCYGTERPIVFEMEPDFYQYTYDSQTSPMTPTEAGQIMTQFVEAMRPHLPNAVFSLDISPWVNPGNGEDHGLEWYSNFDLSLFSAIHTSGGSTDASSSQIRDSNNMTWSGVNGVTQKPILADTGYGVNGASEGHDANWDNPAFINQRIADGVVSISQYNPNGSWASTIAQLRGQLDLPPGCQ